jgi:hypothetical protein
VTPPTDRNSRARPWAQIDKDLHKLQHRGLNNPRLNELRALVDVANELSDKPTPGQRVEDALAQAIDACWEEELGDAMRLWFGLPALKATQAPDTRTMTSTERHKVASEHWEHESESTFRTSGAARRYQSLAKKLVELAARPEAVKPSTQPPAASQPGQDAVVEVDATSRSDDPADLRAWRPTKGRLASMAIAVLIMFAGITWTIWQSSNGKTIPPLGAVVNAETGKVSLYVPPKPAHYPARIGGGPIFRGCNVATEHPCKFPLQAPPISAHVGSVIEFSLRLHDNSGTPVPYLKLHATWQGIKGLSAGDVLHELEATASVQWSYEGSESIDEPGRMEGHGHSQVPYVHIHLPYSGLYGLEYVPGSSKLLGNKGELIQYLPDGIMGYGIALQDVGSPLSCNECASQYLRFVNFQARVVAHE